MPVNVPEAVTDDPVEPLIDVPSMEGAVVGDVEASVEGAVDGVMEGVVGVSVVEASVVVGEQRRSPLQRLHQKPVAVVEPIVVGKVVGDGLVEKRSVENGTVAVVLVGSDEITERSITFET